MELAQSSAQRIVDGVLENYGKWNEAARFLDAASKLLDDLSVADQFIGTAFGKDCFSALPCAAAPRACRRTRCISVVRRRSMSGLPIESFGRAAEALFCSNFLDDSEPVRRPTGSAVRCWRWMSVRRYEGWS